MSNNDSLSTSQQAADESEEELEEESSELSVPYEDSPLGPIGVLRLGGSIAETTPSQRARYPPLRRPKERVTEVDPNGGRCLIENCSAANGIEYAHCVPRHLSKDHDLMSRLEWFWNMQYGTLNLDTRYNLFPLVRTIHFSFNKPAISPAWTLMPMNDIVDTFMASLVGLGREADRTRFPDLSDQSTFQYQFLQLPYKAKWPLQTARLVRQRTMTNADAVPSQDDFKVYTHPFEGYPIVTSHLRPHFVILETGRKLGLLPRVDFLVITKQFPILEKITQIYEAWTNDIPNTAEGDKPYKAPPPSHPPSDHGSHITRSQRIPFPESRRIGNQSPTPAAPQKKRKTGDGNKDGEGAVDDEFVGSDAQTEPGRCRFPTKRRRHKGPRSAGAKSQLSGKNVNLLNHTARTIPPSRRISDWLMKSPTVETARLDVNQCIVPFV